VARHEVIAWGDFDFNFLGEGLAKPGMDPRQWVSFGIVESGTEDATAQVVEFDTELGPLVSVTLQPSGVSVACRVAGQVAGNLEAEYNPFQAGDEVLVVVPEGDEMAGCTIIGRLSNALDAWPGAVAGQDSTQNMFAFRRQTPPYIFEFASSYMVRSGGTGALLSFTQDGVATLNDGNNNFLSMSADNVTLQSSDANEMLQFDLHQSILYLQGGATTGSILTLGDTSGFFSAGTLSLNTAGNPAIEHALSTEAMLNMLNQFVPLLVDIMATALATVPPSPTFPGGNVLSQALLAAVNVGTVAGVINAMLPIAANSTIATILANIGPAIAQKQGDPSGNFPGVGSPGILVG
jgi:hypothetical protein